MAHGDTNVVDKSLGSRCQVAFIARGTNNHGTRRPTSWVWKTPIRLEVTKVWQQSFPIPSVTAVLVGPIVIVETVAANVDLGSVSRTAACDLSRQVHKHKMTTKGEILKYRAKSHGLEKVFSRASRASHSKEQNSEKPRGSRYTKTNLCHV